MANKSIGYVLFLSIVAALGGFLFGYDAAVISGTIQQVSLQYELSSIQQGWYVGCALVGSIVGVLIAGVICEKLGRKKAMIFSAVLFALSGIGCAVVANMNALIIYRIIGGVGIGMISIISPMYISEVAIAKYRGQLVALYQLAITVGFLGAYLVNYKLLAFSQSHVSIASPFLNKIMKDEVWRSMLGMEAIPAVLFFLIIFFIPESPRWLILKQYYSKAEVILSRIYQNKEVAANQIEQIKEQIGTENAGSWKLLFRPKYRKALLVGVAIAILGQFMGVNAVLYYGPTIFKNSGLSDGDSLFYQVLVGLVNTLTTVLAVFIIDKVGRKKLIYYGVSGMILSLICIGIYFSKGQIWKLSNNFLLFFFLFYVFCCAISICAVVFVLLSEMYPNAVRGGAMAIAGFSLWVGTYLIGQLTPWMLETMTPSGTFLFFATMCIPYMLIVWKLVPETTGKTLEEIEALW